MVVIPIIQELPLFPLKRLTPDEGNSPDYLLLIRFVSECIAAQRENEESHSADRGY